MSAPSNTMGGASAWRFDVDNAPKGRMVEVPGAKGGVRRVHKPDQVIIACSDGLTVTLSRWLPDEQRWNMIGKSETVVAWMDWPKHPAITPQTEGQDQ